MDTQALISKIREEKNKHSLSFRRYPVRFIPMELNGSTVTDIMQLSQQLDLEIVELSKKLSHDDAWLTKESLINVIEDTPTSRDLLVVGLTELAKFYSYAELEAVVITLLTDVENTSDNGSRRIYFACFALTEQIQKVIKGTYNKGRDFDPFIEYQDTSALPVRKVFFVEPSLDLTSLPNTINTTHEWLSMWRSSTIDCEKPVICQSQTLYRQYSKARPDNVLEIQKIENYPDVISEIFGMEISIPYIDKEEACWKQLVIALSKEKLVGGFFSLLQKLLKVSQLNQEEIVSVWYTKGYFERWLIKGYLRACGDPNYVTDVINDADIYKISSFTNSAWLTIFKTQKYRQGSQRKKMIALLRPYTLQFLADEKLCDAYNLLFVNYLKKAGCSDDCLQSFDCASFSLVKLQKVTGLSTDVIRAAIRNFFDEVGIHTLTEYSFLEKRLILALYQNNVISELELKCLWENAEWYFDQKCGKELQKGLEGTYEYLFTYRQCRLGKIDATKLKSSREKMYNDKDGFFRWYYTLENPKEQLSHYSSVRKVYVWDGVGGEYLDYIVSTLKANGKSVTGFTLAKSYLPSTTDISKALFPASYIWIRDFDEQVIHGETYNSTRNLCKALNLLDELVKRVIEDSNDEPFAIIADHGSTVSPKLLLASKKHSFSDAEHAGRCKKFAEGENPPECTDYMVCTGDDQNKWLIALNEISLENTSKYEVHGGALIEEVVTPVIIVGKEELIEQAIPYKINPINLNISGLNKTISFEILPKPAIVPIIMDGENKVTALNYKDGKWEGKVSNGKSQTVKLTVDGQTYEFKAMSHSLNKGGDGFDD